MADGSKPHERIASGGWDAASRRPDDEPLVVHLLSGLEIGGKERVAVRLARQGLREGGRHELWLFDTPFRCPDIDLDPTPASTCFLPRRSGWDVRFVRMLARHIRTRRVGVIHAHNDTALCYAALARTLIRGRVTRPALIATFHTWPTHPTPRARLVTRLAATQADVVAAVSDDLGRRLTDSGWLPHCRTIWNGVDLDEFSPVGDDGDWHARLGVAPGSKLVVHLARFDPIKRHVDVIEAARVVHARHPDAVFVLAGRGPLLDEMRLCASALPFVRFVGNVAAPAALLRAASVFVLPSEDEAAPLALLEAMASGCACVCTNVGGMPAMLRGTDGRPSGLLVPARDPGALADAVSRLLDSPALRRDLGSRACASAERFSFVKEWAAYRSAYGGSR